MRRTFITVKETLFCLYVADALAALNDCEIGRILDVAHIDLLGEPTDRYKIYDVMKKGELLLDRKEHKMCV